MKKELEDFYRDLFCDCQFPNWFSHPHGVDVCRSCSKIAPQHEKEHVKVLTFLLNESADAGNRVSKQMDEITRSIDQLKETTKKYSELIAELTK